MRKSHKEELFRVAFRLFVLESFDAVSIPDIEKASGFTRGAIFYYADTKLDLFKQVLEHYVIDKQSIDNKVLATDDENVQKLEAISLSDFIDVYVDAIQSTMKSLLKAIDMRIKKSRVSRAYLKMNIQIAEMLPELHKRQLSMIEREKEVWKTVLGNAVSRGEIKSDINIDIMAKVFIDLFYGNAFSAALSDKIDPEMLRQEMKCVYASIC